MTDLRNALENAIKALLEKSDRESAEVLQAILDQKSDVKDCPMLTDEMEMAIFG